MSQGGAEAFNLARTAYLRILPLLGPALQVGLSTAVGAFFLGPVGAVPGAAAGVLTTQMAQRIVDGFRIVLMFVRENPTLMSILGTAVAALLNFIRTHQGQENQLEN